MKELKKPDLSIIIVNYNTKQLTCNCINSIIDKTSGLNYEIILVDNASHDDSVAFFKKNFPDLIIIESSENLGFGRANNLAADVANADTLFLLNSDTIVIDNSIKVLYDYLQMHADVGVCGGLLLNEDGSIGYSSSPQLTLKHYFRMYFPLFRSIPVEGTITMPTDVGYVIGADMMMSKNVFEKAGRFDPDFFLYCEESELSYRIKKMGYKIHLLPSARIIHLGGMSGSSKNETNDFIAREQWYSRFLYFRKVYNRKQPYYLYALVMTLYSVSMIKGLFDFNRRKVLKNRIRILKQGFRKYRETWQ